MTSTVLFDLDGTLLDTLRDLAESANEALQELGYPTHPLDAYRYLVGEGMTTLVRRALPEQARDTATVERGLAMLKRYYQERWSRHTRLYDGVAELLDALAARRVQLAIVSNKADEFVQEIVRHYFAPWPWAAVHGARPPMPHKPDPRLALEIAASLGAPPATALFVGDSNVDMQTAVAAGMVPVGVLWGFRDAAELRASGALHLLAKPIELLALLPA